MFTLISYPDLTLSYAEKWDLPFPWPREIWVRDYVHGILNNVRATTKIIPDRASVRTQERLRWRDFCDGAKLRLADLLSGVTYRIGVRTTTDNFSLRKSSAIVWAKHKSNTRGIKKNKFVSPQYTHIYYHIMLMLISHYKGKTSFTQQYQFLVNYFLIQSCAVTVLCSYWVGLIFVSVLKLETILLVILRYLTHMIIWPFHDHANPVFKI